MGVGTIERGLKMAEDNIGTVELSPQAQALKEQFMRHKVSAESTVGSIIHNPQEMKNHARKEPGIWAKLTSFLSYESPHSKISSGYDVSDDDPSLKQFNPPKK